MLRRGLALGGGLVALIVVVLGVKGCLDARAHRELSDYARDVTEIVEGTEQTSKRFFGKLEDPGNLSVTEFTNEVSADSSAMSGYASRIDGLSSPGDVGSAQGSLELVYELRAGAMEKIAAKMSTALGDSGSTKATAAIAKQMQTLLAGDVIYEEVVRPEINGVLATNGISGSDVPKSSVLPSSKWLEESSVDAAIGAISGGGGGETSGIHGLGIGAVGVNGVELVEGAPAVVGGEETPEVEVQVVNQGESTENGVSVSVSVDGGSPLVESIESIAAGETSAALIPLTPSPTGTVTLEIEVETVPGEKISTNNEASYSVTFE
jgi:hypothetical protein